MRPINIHLDPKLTAQTRRLAQLTLILKNNLPPECHDHFHVAGIRDDTIIIITDSPVWTTRLRQLSPLILQSLTYSALASSQPNAIQQQLLHVRVVSRYGNNSGLTISGHKTTTIKRKISPQSRRQIAQTASYIHDKKLKNALLKISKHGNKKEVSS